MGKKTREIDDVERERLKRAFSKQANYKTSTGYTGNKKSVNAAKREKQKTKTYSNKQRKLEHLTRNQRRDHWRLQYQLFEMFEKNSMVTRKEEGKKTKKDYKNGLSVEGIWTSTTFKQYFDNGKRFLKYCVKEFDVKNFREIKPRMLHQYISEEYVKNGRAAKTTGAQMTAVKKMVELTSKEGINSMKKILTKNIVDLVPEYNSEEYRRGKKDGYSIKHAQVMAKKADKMFSRYHRAAIEVLAFCGLRMDEFQKVKWRNLDFENNRIYLTDPNVTKGNRPRFVPAPEKTMQLLKNIMDENLHTSNDERIFGSRMNEAQTRLFIKQCSRAGKVRYSGAHDFRRSCVQMHINLLEKEFKKGTLTKEKLVDRILDQVGTKPQLNPMVEVKTPRRDSNGKIIYATRKDGTKYIKYWDKEKDEFGKVIKKPKFGKEDLMKRRIDFIKNSYLSQVLGHNRSSVTAIYKSEENKRPKKKTTK